MVPIFNNQYQIKHNYTHPKIVFNRLTFALVHPHIPFEENGIGKHYEIDMNKRFFVERKVLADIFPLKGIVLNKNTQKEIIELLKARYERTALPDSFNDRLPIKKIKNLLKEHSFDIYGFFIDIDPEEELPQDNAYNIRLIMLVKKREDALEELMEDIVNEIQDGINVVEYRVKTKEEMRIF